MPEIKEQMESTKESMCHAGTCVDMHRFCFRNCCLTKCVAVVAILGAVFAAGFAAGMEGEGGHRHHGHDRYGEYKNSRSDEYGARGYGGEQDVHMMRMMSAQRKMMISAPLDQTVSVQQVVPTAVAPTAQ